MTRGYGPHAPVLQVLLLPQMPSFPHWALPVHPQVPPVRHFGPGLQVSTQSLHAPPVVPHASSAAPIPQVLALLQQPPLQAVVSEVSHAVPQTPVVVSHASPAAVVVAAVQTLHVPPEMPHAVGLLPATQVPPASQQPPLQVSPPEQVVLHTPVFVSHALPAAQSALLVHVA